MDFTIALGLQLIFKRLGWSANKKEMELIVAYQFIKTFMTRLVSHEGDKIKVLTVGKIGNIILFY